MDTGSLEIIGRRPDTPSSHLTPLLFVHGAYVGAWCWEENFLSWFAERGWAVHAFSLTGHGGSRGRAGLDNLGIKNYVADVAEVIETLPRPPVLIGHSMGGMVVQKYLEQASAPAAVLMASVPPQGLFYSTISLLLTAPKLFLDLNRIMGGGEPGLDSLREALFHQPISTDKLLRYWELSQPESHRAIWDMTFYDLPRTSRTQKIPLLVLGAQNDRLVSPFQVRMTAKAYGIQSEIFPDMGHAMMLEPGWEKVATRLDGWLTEQGF